MNPNQTRTLWISVGLGILAMFLIYSYSQEKKAEYDKKYGTLKRIVVAKKTILEMETIDETQVEYKEVPVDFAQPGAMEDIEEVVNRVAAVPFKEGEQILDNKTLSLGPNTGLAHQVAPNKRAVSVPVDDVRGVSKLLIPGDHIDILASIDVGTGPNRKTEVRTIMQDVAVLATGVRITNNIPRTIRKESFSDKSEIKKLTGDTSFAAITVEASPQEAQNLVYILATAPGSLYLTLRNPNDRVSVTMPSSNTSSLLGLASEPILNKIAPVVVAPPPPPPARKPASRKGPFVEVK